MLIKVVMVVEMEEEEEEGDVGDMGEDTLVEVDGKEVVVQVVEVEVG